MRASSPSVTPNLISVVVVSWNARDYLRECLDSIRRNGPESVEVIVVDNASDDGSPEMVGSEFPDVLLIQTGANLGFSKANNLGIQRASGEYVCLVNSDVHVLPGCFEQLREFLELNARAGMVGPRVLWGNRSIQSSCRRFPTLWNNLCEVLGLNRSFPRSPLFAGEHMYYFAYDCPAQVEVLVGCFIMARRSAIERFGGLDEQFFMYGEDVDWCERCNRAGWAVMYCPYAEAIHYAGGSSVNDRPRFTVEQLRARLQLWRKYYKPATVLLFQFLLTLQTASRLVRSLSKHMSTLELGKCPTTIQSSFACLCVVWQLHSRS